MWLRILQGRTIAESIEIAQDVPVGPTCPVHGLSLPQDAWAKASDLAASLRKKGTTSAVECLIATVATTRDAILIHCGSDLPWIAKHTGMKTIDWDEHALARRDSMNALLYRKLSFTKLRGKASRFEFTGTSVSMSPPGLSRNFGTVPLTVVYAAPTIAPVS